MPESDQRRQHAGRIGRGDLELVKNSIAAAASAIPVGTSGRGPVRGSSRALTWVAVAMMQTTIGRKARPVSTGEKPERLLQVEGEEQEDAEHPGAGDGHRQVGAAAGAVEDDAHRQQRVGDAALDRDEGGEQEDAGAEADDRQRRAPAVGFRAREAVDDPEQAEGGGDRTRNVDLRGAVSDLVDDQGEGADRGRNREGEVDVHGPAPGDVLGEDAAEQKTDGGTTAGDRAEDAERLAALGRVGEGRGQQRERARGEQCAEHALQRARGDQHLEAGRGAADRRGGGEPEQADDEDALATEDVADAPAEQQQRAEREGIGRDHPLAIVVGEAEIGLGGGEGDVDDRHVEDDHQLRDPDHAEDPPAAVVLGEGLNLLRHLGLLFGCRCRWTAKRRANLNLWTQRITNGADLSV